MSIAELLENHKTTTHRLPNDLALAEQTIPGRTDYQLNLTAPQVELQLLLYYTVLFNSR